MVDIDSFSNRGIGAAAVIGVTFVFGTDGGAQPVR